MPQHAIGDLSHYNQDAYQQQLTDKTDALHTQLAPFYNGKLDIYPSAIQHFRMRAEFRIWHDGDQCCYAMFERGEKASRKSLIKIEQFPTANQAINELMPKLLNAIHANTELKNRLFQVEFLSTTRGEILVTLIYHRKINEQWDAVAQPLEDTLGVHIIGRSRGQKRVLSQDYVLEAFNLDIPLKPQTFEYKQFEGGFTQPNAGVCQQMLTWAVKQAHHCQAKKKDLLELYCGNGNFTLPLSTQFRRVLATEVSKTSVNAALWNAERNRNDNIRIARLSSEEFTQAYNQEREFERLKRAHIDLTEYDFNTVFVDPPRAGVDDNTLRLLARFEHILYISCNPNTLCNNLEKLTKTHCIQRAALFDQFPYTHHAEAGVWLTRL